MHEIKRTTIDAIANDNDHPRASAFEDAPASPELAIAELIRKTIQTDNGAYIDDAQLMVRDNPSLRDIGFRLKLAQAAGDIDILHEIALDLEHSA